MPKPADVGVVVARFQVHRLHDAHIEILNTVASAHKHMIVVLGLSPSRVTRRNPLDFESRRAMLLEAYPSATVLYLRDQRDDAVGAAGRAHRGRHVCGRTRGTRSARGHGHDGV